MTEAQRDECLIQLVKSVGNLNSKIDEVNSSLNAKIDNINSSLSSRIDNIEAKLDENIAFTRRINQSVAVIEEVHGGKLTALFDGYKANSEKLDKIETDIQDIYSILQKHEDKFFVIESK